MLTHIPLLVLTFNTQYYLFYLQNIESAIQDCTHAIELDPDYLRAYTRRSKLFERNDKLDEALDDLKKVLEIDPRYGEVAYDARVSNNYSLFIF